MEEDLTINFAAICLKLRHHLGLTQPAMAKRLKTPLRTYQDWEHGTTIPNGYGAYRLAKLQSEIEKEEFKERIMSAVHKALKKID